jgi:hypothetical protein
MARVLAINQTFHEREKEQPVVRAVRVFSLGMAKTELRSLPADLPPPKKAACVEFK